MKLWRLFWWKFGVFSGENDLISHLSTFFWKFCLWVWRENWNAWWVVEVFEFLLRFLFLVVNVKNYFFDEKSFNLIFCDSFRFWFRWVGSECWAVNCVKLFFLEVFRSIILFTIYVFYFADHLGLLLFSFIDLVGLWV